MPTSLKGKVHKTMIRNLVTFGVGTETVMKIEETLLE